MLKISLKISIVKISLVLIGLGLCFIPLTLFSQNQLASSEQLHDNVSSQVEDSTASIQHSEAHSNETIEDNIESADAETEPTDDVSELSSSAGAQVPINEFTYTSIQPIVAGGIPNYVYLQNRVLSRLREGASRTYIPQMIGYSMTYTEEQGLTFDPVLSSSYRRELRLRMPRFPNQLSETVQPTDQIAIQSKGLYEIADNLYIWVPKIEFPDFTQVVPEPLAEAYTDENILHYHSTITLRFENTEAAVNNLNTRALYAVNLNIKQFLMQYHPEITSGALWISHLEPNMKSLIFLPDSYESAEPYLDPLTKEAIPTETAPTTTGYYELQFTFHARINANIMHELILNPPPPPPIVFSEIKGLVFIQKEGERGWQRVTEGDEVPSVNTRLYINGEENFVRLTQGDRALPYIWGDRIIMNLQALFEEETNWDLLLSTAYMLKRTMHKVGLLFDPYTAFIEEHVDSLSPTYRNLFRTVHTLYNRGEYDLVIDSLRTIMGDRSLADHFHLMIVGAYINLLDFDAALEYLPNVSGIIDDDTSIEDHIEFTKAFIYHLQGEYRASNELFNEVLDGYPDSCLRLDIEFFIGMNYVNMGQKYRALEKFRYVSERFMDNPAIAHEARKQMQALFPHMHL